MKPFSINSITSSLMVSYFSGLRALIFYRWGIAFRSIFKWWQLTVWSIPIMSHAIKWRYPNFCIGSTSTSSQPQVVGLFQLAKILRSPGDLLENFPTFLLGMFEVYNQWCEIQFIKISHFFSNSHFFRGSHHFIDCFLFRSVHHINVFPLFRDLPLLKNIIHVNIHQDYIDILRFYLLGGVQIALACIHLIPSNYGDAICTRKLHTGVVNGCDGP